jgi:multidrug transporter EmrE-like cation transporter
MREMKNKWIAVLMTIVWVCIATYGDTLFKSAKGGYSWKFMLGCCVYASTGLFALWILNAQQWGWVTVLWNAIQLALSLILSVAVYSEPFTIRRRIAAILLLGAILICD